MKVTGIETIQLDEFGNILFVHVATDEGITGLGETFFGAPEVASYLHDTVAPKLIGQDPGQIDRLRVGIPGYVGTKGTGVERRGMSALDMALWDIKGKRLGAPVYDLLGGASHDRVRVYNTCAGYRYVRKTVGQALENWGTGTGSAGPYEDLDAWLTGDAGELAESLLAMGITGMKMWPFDGAAYRTSGTSISPAELDAAMVPFRRVREVVGNRMDLMVELHGLWQVPAALQIAQAFEREDIRPFWIEDPVRPDDIAALARFAHGTRLPTTASELLGNRGGFRELLEARAASYVMLDLGWCGGITEGKAIATLAESFGLPIAPHDCTGPVTWAAGCHLSVNAPNTLIQEAVRAFYTGWYTELVTGLPIVADGHVTVAPAPGHGVALLPGLADRPDAVVRRTGQV